MDKKMEQEMAAFQELAFAVILQAWMDAEHWRDSYTRSASRRFLTGATKAWRESLEDWCDLARKDPTLVIKKARQRYWSQERIEKYKRMGR